MGENLMKNNIDNNNLDPNDPRYLDSIELDKKRYTIGLLKAIFLTGVAAIIFFVPITVDGKTDIVFGFTYRFFINLFGDFGLWIATGAITINALASMYGKFIAKKDTRLYKYYEGDSVFHPFIYLLGAVYAILYLLHVSFSQFVGPEWIVGPDTGGVVIPGIVLATMWVLPVGAFFMPFLLNYGGIDFIGAILEPLMRPVFKVPGKSAVDAVTSFVTSSSMAVIITSKLYKTNVYTKREASVIATCFSAVSVGFAMVVIKTSGLSEHFPKVYFSSFLIAFLISIVMVRIPPLSKIQDIFYNGRTQTDKERVGGTKLEPATFKRGVDRAAKKAYTANNIFKEIGSSLVDGYVVLPKVLTFISAVGISGLIIAEYTPFFNWLGMIFVPLLKICQVPNVLEIAPSIPVGIAEMFLPVLLIADKVEILDIGARYFVTALSMVQIIFFSETVAVMLATKMPIKLGQLVICFLERTLIGIPIVALAMHILF